MTNLLPLVISLLEILGLGVHPSDSDASMVVGRETSIVGDVLRVGTEPSVVSWCRDAVPASPRDSRCFVSLLAEGGVAARSPQPVFQGAGLCGASSVRLGSVGGAVIAATACADRPGLWAWVEPFTKAGEPQSVPLPVSPESGLEQTEPIVLSGDSGSGWLVWLEAGAFDQDRRTARARHLDSAGEPIGETVSLSEVGVARAGLVGTHLVAAPLPGGGLVAAWRAQPDRRISLRFRTFDERGRPATPPTDLGVALVSGPEPFWIVTDDAGRITLLWWARDEGGSGRLFAASYSVDAKPRAGPAPLTGAPVKHWPQIAAVGTSGGRQLIAWADVDPGSGEPRIGLRRWSPELGPLGLTSWIDGSVARSWPFLKLLPGDAGGSFTLYWKETLDDAMEGRIAVLHWRDLRVGQ